MSAWEPNDATDIIVLNRAAKRHTLRFLCSGRKRIEITKCWIDNFNTGLDDPNHPHIMSNYATAGTGIPNMGYFPFFFDPTWTVHGETSGVDSYLAEDDMGLYGTGYNTGMLSWDEAMEYWQENQTGDIPLIYQAYGVPDLFYDYDVPYNVESGLITHPLGLINQYNADAMPWTWPGYLTDSIRNNYRLNGVIRLGNSTMDISTSDYMDVNVIFRPVFTDNYRGRINIEYWSYAPYHEDPQFYGISSPFNLPMSDPNITTKKMFASYELEGAINKTNLSEMDQTSIENISIIEDVNFENPYTSIILQ